MFLECSNPISFIVFMIKFNSAFLRPAIPRPMTQSLGKSKHKSVKFVDDGAVATSIDLKSSLVPDPVQRPKPLCFQERTMHILPDENNLMQYIVKDTENYTVENKMT